MSGIFTLREFTDFYELPPAEMSVRERFYLWCMDHPFWSCGRGSGDGVFFASAYGDELWRKLIIRPVWRGGCMLYSAKNWIKARTFWGMHVIRTDLEPSTYYDPDTQILYAVMACNDRYVGDGWWIIDVDQECIEIAHWWNVGRPAEERLRDEMLDELFGEGRSGCYTQPHPTNDHLTEIKFADRSSEWEARNKEFRALEAKIAADETEMLIRIMKIREHMWI